jgi:hypothetical protein
MQEGMTLRNVLNISTKIYNNSKSMYGQWNLNTILNIITSCVLLYNIIVDHENDNKLKFWIEVRFWIQGLTFEAYNANI